MGACAHECKCPPRSAGGIISAAARVQAVGSFLKWISYKSSLGSELFIQP